MAVRRTFPSLTLVTGANGYIARALIKCLVAEGERVRATTRGGPADANDPGSRAAPVETFAVGELNAGTEWRPALDGVECLIHLAAIAHVPHGRGADRLTRYRTVNFEASARLFEAAASAGVRRVVFASSILVNGPRNLGGPFTELSRAAPADAYSEAKYLAEQALQVIAPRRGLEWVILRPTMVYGPGAPGNMARLIRLVRTRLPIPLASATAKRSFIGIDNMVAALVSAITVPAAANNLYLLADDEAVSVGDLIRMIERIGGFAPRLFPVPAGVLRAGAGVVGKGAIVGRLLDPNVVDSTKIRRDLGWAPVKSLEAGLAEMIRGV